jgi:hypothetical protein
VNRSRAVVAAFFGVTVTATGAFGATTASHAPVRAIAVEKLAQDHGAVGGPNDNHGGLVSTLARGTNGAPGATSDTRTVGTSDVTNTAQGDHGAAVSAVAKDVTIVGGPNDNHGGAVSAVARGTHGQAPAPQAVTRSQAETHPVPPETPVGPR